jgi:hypothetical protein
MKSSSIAVLRFRRVFINHLRKIASHVAGVTVLLILSVLLEARSAMPQLPALNDVRIQASTTSSFDFEFRPAGWQIDTLRDGSSTCSRFDFPDAIVDSKPGAFQIPYKVVVLGIPVGSRVQVEATPGPYTDLRNVDLARVLELQRNEEGVEYWRMPPAAVTDAGFQPVALATADEPAMFRYQQIVRIKVSPMQYDAATKTVRRYESLAVRVRFIGGKQSAPSLETSQIAAAAKVDEFYAGILANTTVARSFREKPARSVLRSTSSVSTGSTLAAGQLYKINIRSEGLYRITGQFLASRGIALADINPATLQMFNNGGRELPRTLNASRPQGLEEIAIWVEDGGDGRFDTNDYILFYGRGVDGFEYNPTTGQAVHYLHHYAFDNVYWLTWGIANGKRMATQQLQPTAGATVATDFRDRFYNEQELRSLYGSGLDWFGWLFTNDAASRTRTYRFTLTDVVAASPARFRFAFIGWVSANHQFNMTLNEAPLHSTSFFGQFLLRTAQVDKANALRSGENTLAITYTPSIDEGQCFIDYFEVAYDRVLRVQNNMLAFDGRTGGSVTAYQVENAGGLWFFEVSDYRNVKRLNPAQIQFSGTQALFADSTGAIVPRRYLAASPNASAVNDLQLDAPSSWRTPDHSAEFVIITHEDFYSDAMRLKSLRENLLTDDPLKTEVVKIQDVFDEFSGGLYDPTAIRDFLKYTIENWQEAPQHVLLFGDGDHDPKNILDKADKNWLPTYQTTGEFDEISSRTTDHWFTYVAGTDAIMDMAIGRIPARTPQQAKDYVDKVIAYLDPSQTAFGVWRNTLLFAADDDLRPRYPGGEAVESIHIEDTERLAENSIYTPQVFDIRKLYETEFPGVQSASISGIRKPAATEALIREINTGALIINFVGHGAPDIWTDERLLTLASDYDKIQNGPRQAVWVTATCDFGRFDNPTEQSFGENIVLEAGRGAIAMLTSSRKVFAYQNGEINRAYYRALFSTPNIATPLGLALMRARIITGQTVNDEKFLILGDPTIRPAMPRHPAQITGIEPDTIKALSLMTVRGTVMRNGDAWNDFNGQVYVEALDSRRPVRYQSAANTISYMLPGNAVFRGAAPVTDGRFSLQFFVPKDITYGGSSGRFNIYFAGQNTDGNAAVLNLPVGGGSQNFVDQAGPEISIGFAGVEDFAPGGVVGLNPVLKVTIFDSLSGVNITGEIGHKVTLALDGDVENKIDLTDLFNYDSGSYKRGSLLYQLTDLSEGRHTAQIKAWDNFNNSGAASVEFTVLPQDRLTLSEVMNYPNPFRNETSFTFVASRDAEVAVKIFTLSGRLIRTIEATPVAPGFNAILWNGEDGDGDTPANGVYLYKLIATSNDGGRVLRAESIGKMVVAR